MSPLHLVHLPLELKPFHQWAADRGLGWTGRRHPDGRTRNVAFDEGRALHHLLAETFGKGVLQPFRLLVAPGHASGSVYAYSASAKEALAATVRETAMPETLAICGPDRLAVKAMSEAWREGRRLSFDIRVRPVRRLFKAAGVFPKGAEVDAFHIETLRRFPDGRPVDDDDRVKREAVYAQWLAERLDGAASVEKVRLVRFSRHRAARNGNAPEGPDATLHGELVVHQPLAFAERLAKGIGRHTAYGYGMLLLRPAGRA